MLSASTNTLHPAFSGRAPDRKLTATGSIPADRQLSREQLRVWSYQEAPLTVGAYTLTVSQHVQATDPDSKQSVSQDLKSPDTQLRVSSPKFRLADPQGDIYSVYPASGHSEHAETLAHVILGRATAPWERRLDDDKGNADHGSNRMPWLGVLSFVEGELVLDEKTCRAAGFADTTPPPSSQGIIATTAGELENLAGVISPLSGNSGVPSNQKGYVDKEEVSIFLIERLLFQSLFGSYNGAAGEKAKEHPTWGGAPDLRRFLYMAHVRETHGGFMASTLDLMSSSGTGVNPQPQFSVVVSPRSGLPGEETPRRVISHLISLEGLAKMKSDLQPEAKFAALVSLFSWDWMCVPQDHTDFKDTMVNLGKNVRPLRIEMPVEHLKRLDDAEDQFQKDEEKAKKADGETASSSSNGKGEPNLIQDLQEPKPARQDPMAAWLKRTLESGYTLKPHTLLNGRVTRSLLRGPLIPVAPAREMVNPFSLTGEDLGLVDSDTGLQDVSYKMAWYLGRALTLANRSLTAALLRLRGNMHALAVKRIKARRAATAATTPTTPTTTTTTTTTETKSANGSNSGAQTGTAVMAAIRGELTAAACLGALQNSVGQLEKGHDISELAQKGGASSRWLRTERDRQNRVVIRLVTAGAPPDLEGDSYTEEIQTVANAFFGYPPPPAGKKPEGNSSDGDHKIKKADIPYIPQRPIDPDAVLVRAWALDKLYLAGVPLHYLLPDPDMLPRESIRTFCIDPKWVASAIDGGLAIANHFARGDDAVRQAIKTCVNRYLAEPLPGSKQPGEATTLQVPRWGFLLRSVAVTAFPDLKVEAQFSEAVPDSVREVLYMQVLADDILVCLFDRVPGESNFERIHISQPPHQQSFAVGSKLTATTLKAVFQPVPLVALSSLAGDEKEKMKQMLVPITKYWSPVVSNNNNNNQDELVYDWDVRMLRPDAFLKQYVRDLAGRDGTKVWKWTGSEQDVPSAALALQLSTRNLQLTLHLEQQRNQEVAKGGADGDGKVHSRWTEPAFQLPVGPRRKDPSANDSQHLVSAAPATQTPRQRTFPPDAKWVPLPTGLTPATATAPAPVPDSSSVSTVAAHKLTNKGLVDENNGELLLPHAGYPPEAKWKMWPHKVACSSLFDPDPDPSTETSLGWESGASTICALNTPMDLIFELKMTKPEPSKPKIYPNRLEVRIPVKLAGGSGSSGSGSDSVNSLLVIPGTAAAPVLPTVEGLNGSALWSYTVRLVVGGLYKTPPEKGDPGYVADGGDKVALHAGESLLLVVTAQPRFGQDRMKDVLFDGSFLLRRVSVAKPGASASYKTQFDTSWAEGLVYPRQVTVRPAITLKIGEPTYVNLDERRLFMTVSSLATLGPDEEAVWEAKLRSGSKKQLVSSPLPSTELRTSTTSSHLSDVSLQSETGQSPECLQLYVVSKSTKRPLGSRTAPLFFPEIPPPLSPTDMRFTWDDAGVHVSWKPPSKVLGISGTAGVDKPVRFCFMADAVQTELETGSAFLKKGVHISDSDFHDDGTVRITQHVRLTSKRLTGILERNTRAFNLLRLGTSFPQFNLSALPAVHPLGSIAMWYPWSELWFVAADNTITGIRCRRDLKKSGVDGAPTELFKPEVQNSGTVPMSAGALEVYHGTGIFNQFMCWVRPDGGLGGLMRDTEDGQRGKQWGLLDNTGSDNSDSPFKSAAIVGTARGGSICTFVLGTAIYKLWVGPKGDIRGVSGSDNDGLRGGSKLLWGEGEAAVGVSHCISVAVCNYFAGANIFWVSPQGGLRWSRVWDTPTDSLSFKAEDLVPKDGGARIAVGTGGAGGGCGPIALGTRRRGEPKDRATERLFVFWIDGVEGRVWGASTLLPTLDGGDVKAAVWTKFCVTPLTLSWPAAALAHPTASRLTLLRRSIGAADIDFSENFDPDTYGGSGYILYLLWFDTEGHLRAARAVDDESAKFAEWTECMLPDDVAKEVLTAPPAPGAADTGRKMELVVLPSAFGDDERMSSVHDLFWLDKDGRLRSMGVDMAVRPGS